MSYNLSSICGQSKLKSQLSDLWQNDAHAVLIIGDVGSGRKLAARVLASAFLCPNVGREGGCGSCKSCRTFAEFNHPDYQEILSLDGKRIRVQRLRDEVIGKLSIKPQVNNCKVFLLDLGQIDEAAQNVLLKSLEEPPPFVRFILIAQSLRQVLPTVLSRCITLHTSAVTPDEMSVAFSRQDLAVDKSEINFLHQYAAGNVGRALSIYRDENFNALRQASCQWFFNLAEISKSELILEGYAFFAEERNRVEIILNIWQSLWRDLAASVHSNDELLINRDRQTDLREFVERLELSGENIAEVLDREYHVLKNLRRQLQVNVTYEHAISLFLLQSWQILRNSHNTEVTANA